MNSRKIILISTPLFMCAALLLSGCGGGGSSSSTSTSSSGTASTVSGVAASGAPLANANVTVTCSDGSTQNGTTNDKGEFTISLGASCAAPYVLVAKSESGDGVQSLVSVFPDAISGSARANITPLTNAISATLASDGNPLSLASNIATEKNNITPAAVTSRNQAIVSSLSGMLSNANIQGTLNLITTEFSANRAGLDMILDNLSVEVNPSGVNITNLSGNKVDDMGSLNGATVAADLSSNSISISRSTNFNASIGSLPSAIQPADIADNAWAALNACFQLPAASRINAGVWQGACATLASNHLASDYRHDGKEIPQEWDGMMANTAYDRAVFQKPEIIRYFSDNPSDTRALIRIGIMRVSGAGEWYVSVVEKSNNTGGTWKLRGNQRNFRVGVNAYVSREEQVLDKGMLVGAAARGRTAGTHYHSGLNLNFNGNPDDIDYVKVTGPGFPRDGLILRPMNGCAYWVIASSATDRPTSCTSLFRMQYRKADVSDRDSPYYVNGFGSSDHFFARTRVSDSDIKAIKVFSAYRFQIFSRGNTTPTPDYDYVERLRGRPITLGTNADIEAKSAEVDKLIFNTGLAASAKALINPDLPTRFTGGSSLKIDWINTPNSAAAYSFQAQFRPEGGPGGTLYQDDQNVGPRATTITLTNPPSGWGSVGLDKSSSSNFILIQLRARDKDTDLQFFNNWRY
jgi:hypothetical protein